jgi:hypothetical protein
MKQASDISNSGSSASQLVQSARMTCRERNRLQPPTNNDDDNSKSAAQIDQSDQRPPYVPDDDITPESWTASLRNETIEFFNP